MTNDPELNGKYLGSITQDFVKVCDKLKEASYLLRQNGFDYPIFPICKVEQKIGGLLVEKYEAELNWNFYASYLDELEQRQIITETEQFISTYKNPDEYCCLLVIDMNFINFVFLPYPEE